MEFDSLIPDEITIAPKHPLAHNLELPIPDYQKISQEEVRAIQQRERIPGVVKRIIPLDADISWEYWWCVPGRLLLPEDVELMMHDRDRIESILENLVWLFGGHCFGKDTQRQGDQQATHNWQDVVNFSHQHGFDSYLLDIDFLPNAIKRYSQPANPDGRYVAVEPAHWHIEFFKITPTQGGFEMQEPKTVCSCQIWTGKPFIKNLDTGKTSIHYDLWISRPLDFTEPIWLK